MARRVFVVDDDPLILRLNRAILETAGYEVVEATDGDQLIEQLELGEEVDVIILDLSMPNVGGWGVLRWLKDHGEFGRIPVIVSSSHGEQEFRAAARELGAAFLVKPYSRRDLTGAVFEALRTGTADPWASAT